MHEEGVHQPLALGLHRSDYMLHKQPDGSLQPLQIELNTVAAGFGSLAGKASALHEMLVKLAPSSDAAAGLLPSYESGAPRSTPNRPVHKMAAAIAQAHTAFKASTTHTDRYACILHPDSELPFTLSRYSQCKCAVLDSSQGTQRV